LTGPPHLYIIQALPIAHLMIQPFKKSILLACLLLSSNFIAHPLAAETLPGFTLHFDFIDNWQEAKRLILIAHDNGARVLNVVPPPQLWKLPASKKILDQIFHLTRELHMQIILSRIDACPVSADDPQRVNYLFKNILNHRGVLPSGRATPVFFRETVGLRSYEGWLREETEYYGKNYSGEANLTGFSVGLFNEPFVSQRGSLLCFDEGSDSYEIAQYTKPCLAYWQNWLRQKYTGLDKLNANYYASFNSFSVIPMPKNEDDKRFGDAETAYQDLVSAINDWVVTQYQDCRLIWHKFARRPVPLILQFSGFVPEKFSKGRAAFAELDIFSWMQMADGLGLSLYTNSEYPDRGMASDKAMINFLRLGVLQKKPVFVMEGGNENKGPALNAEELDFYSTAARALRPDSYIYEFLKGPYYARFHRTDGYVVNRAGNINEKALSAVKNALLKTTTEQLSVETYVLDAPNSLSPDDLDIQKQLQQIALEKTLVFVPKSSLALLPDNSSLLVIPENYKLDGSENLSSKGIKIIPARGWIQTAIRQEGSNKGPGSL
jgi:hypothetical protein